MKNFESVEGAGTDFQEGREGHVPQSLDKKGYSIFVPHFFL